MRLICLLFALVACSDESPNDTRTACDIVAGGLACDGCLDAEATCRVDGVEVTAEGCGDCQARNALLNELCDAGSTLTFEEITERMECTVREF